MKNGHRVCLIYNLLRVDSGPVPTLAAQDNILKQLITAADKWESLDPSDAPSKFAILLEHEYTHKNLAFRLLKGKNAAIAATLRLSRRFDLHLALVEKHRIGTTYPNYPTDRVRSGNWPDDEVTHHIWTQKLGLLCV